MDKEFNQVYMQAKGTCPNCGTALTFINALQMAAEHDMDDSVMCHNCGDVYSVELQPDNMVIKDKLKNIPVTKKQYSKRNFAKEFYNDFTKNDGKNGVTIFNEWTEQGHHDANYTYALIAISKLNGVGDQNKWELLYKKAKMTETADDKSLEEWYVNLAEETIGKTHKQINERFSSPSSEDKSEPAAENKSTTKSSKKRFGLGFIKNIFSKNDSSSEPEKTTPPSTNAPKPEKTTPPSAPSSKSHSEPTTGNPFVDMELSKAYDNTMKEREELFEKFRAAGISEEVLSKIEAPPSKEEFFKEYSNPKKIGVVFDIDALGGIYGYSAYKIFFKNLDPLRMGHFNIFDGDTKGSLYGNDNQYCIAVQTRDPGVIDYVKDTMSKADDEGLAPLNQRFIEDPAIEAELLVYAADVANGNVMSKQNGFEVSAANESENWKAR